jgi:hypothetical protein
VWLHGQLIGWTDYNCDLARSEIFRHICSDMPQVLLEERNVFIYDGSVTPPMLVAGCRQFDNQSTTNSETVCDASAFIECSSKVVHPVERYFQGVDDVVFDGFWWASNGLCTQLIKGSFYLLWN